VAAEVGRDFAAVLGRDDKRLFVRAVCSGGGQSLISFSVRALGKSSNNG
jgi:hypothetical protein